MKNASRVNQHRRARDAPSPPESMTLTSTHFVHATTNAHLVGQDADRSERGPSINACVSGLWARTRPAQPTEASVPRCRLDVCRRTFPCNEMWCLHKGLSASSYDASDPEEPFIQRDWTALPAPLGPPAIVRKHRPHRCKTPGLMPRFKQQGWRGERRSKNTPPLSSQHPTLRMPSDCQEPPGRKAQGTRGGKGGDAYPAASQPRDCGTKRKGDQRRSKVYQV